MMTKWDTIQADITDQFQHLKEEEEYYKQDLSLDELADVEDEGDVFGFSKAIQIDHLTDEQVDEIFNMFGDK